MENSDNNFFTLKFSTTMKKREQTQLVKKQAKIREWIIDSYPDNKILTHHWEKDRQFDSNWVRHLNRYLIKELFKGYKSKGKIDQPCQS